MSVIQEQNTLELWNKLHFEENKNEVHISCLKCSVSIFSVDKKNQIDVTFVFFISLLIVSEHVSENHVPIIGSWRLRNVVALCWYVPWLRGGCQDFCILYFSSNRRSTCFGQPCAHHQELTTAWCYSLVLVCAVAAGRLSRLLYSLFLF